MKEKDTIVTTPTGSGAAEPEASSRVELLKSGKKKSCFIRNTSFNDPEAE